MRSRLLNMAYNWGALALTGRASSRSDVASPKQSKPHGLKTQTTWFYMWAIVFIPFLAQGLPLSPTLLRTQDSGARRHLTSTRSRGTRKVAGPSTSGSSDAADDRTPPRPSTPRATRGGQASQSSRAATKRTGDDLDKLTGGARKRRKR